MEFIVDVAMKVRRGGIGERSGFREEE